MEAASLRLMRGSVSEAAKLCMLSCFQGEQTSSKVQTSLGGDRQTTAPKAIGRFLPGAMTQSFIETQSIYAFEAHLERSWTTKSWKYPHQSR